MACAICVPKHTVTATLPTPTRTHTQTHTYKHTHTHTCMHARTAKHKQEQNDGTTTAWRLRSHPLACIEWWIAAASPAAANQTSDLDGHIATEKGKFRQGSSAKGHGQAGTEATLLRAGVERSRVQLSRYTSLIEVRCSAVRWLQAVA